MARLWDGRSATNPRIRGKVPNVAIEGCGRGSAGSEIKLFNLCFNYSSAKHANGVLSEFMGARCQFEVEVWGEWWRVDVRAVK